MLSPAARCYACRHYTLLDLSWISRQLLFNFLRYFFPLRTNQISFMFSSFISPSNQIHLWSTKSMALMNTVCGAGHAWPVHHCDHQQVLGAFGPLWRQKLAHHAKATDAFTVTTVKNRKGILHHYGNKAISHLFLEIQPSWHCPPWLWACRALWI